MKRLLWRAPELLRDQNYPPRGTQKGDVYSFGILLYEIIGRQGPWGNIPLTAQGELDIIESFNVLLKAHETVIFVFCLEIILNVKHHDSRKPFRPQTQNLGAPKYVLKCMESCWEEDPEQRPDIRYVRVKLKEMQAGL